MSPISHHISIALHHQFPTSKNTLGDPFSLSVDLQIPAQGISALIGPSGCGKTTLLRCIAGLEQGQGQLTFNDKVWQNEKYFLASYKRPLAYVFQEASLFSHLNVKENLLYAKKRADKCGPNQDYAHLIHLLALEPLLARQTNQLSGGERQRVAIARALLIQPRLLLMDEPLASLDAHRKQEILPYLLKLKNEFAIPIIYVSHDINEVTQLADYIITMDKGSVTAAGPLKETLNQIEHPIQLGQESSSLIDACIVEKNQQWQLCKVRWGNEVLWLPDQGGEVDQSVRVQILARDVSIALEKPVQSSISNLLSAEVKAIENKDTGPTVLVQLKINNDVILARLTRRSIHQLQLTVGTQVWAQIKSAALIR